MSTTRSARILLACVILAAVMGLSACGSGARTGAAPGSPDSVRIDIDIPVTASGKHPVLTLNNAPLVQGLYATIFALPPEPPDQGCPDDLGPHYTLTFRQGSTTLATVLARFDGCWPVTISGEASDRHASQSFWTQLDEAIYVATPPAHPASLAIQCMPDPARAPRTARISSAMVAQRLYNAILALKWTPLGTGCVESSVPRYQLVFQAPNQSVPALMYDGCNTIDLNTKELEGYYQSRGGEYVMDDQFKQLFQQIVGGATFTPASPDHLTLGIERMYTAGQTTAITDPALMRRLFQETFSLPPTLAQPQPNCLGADKSAGKGTWYVFNFSQWGLPILRMDAFEGSCTYVDVDVVNTRLVVQGNQAFWNLVHQVASRQ